MARTWCARRAGGLPDARAGAGLAEALPGRVRGCRDNPSLFPSHVCSLSRLDIILQARTARTLTNRGAGNGGPGRPAAARQDLARRLDSGTLPLRAPTLAPPAHTYPYPGALHAASGHLCLRAGLRGLRQEPGRTPAHSESARTIITRTRMDASERGAGGGTYVRWRAARRPLRRPPRCRRRGSGAARGWRRPWRRGRARSARANGPSGPGRRSGPSPTSGPSRRGRASGASRRGPRRRRPRPARSAGPPGRPHPGLASRPGGGRLPARCSPRGCATLGAPEYALPTSKRPVCMRQTLF